MAKNSINYELLNLKLKSKADFYAHKIWGIGFTGDI